MQWIFTHFPRGLPTLSSFYLAISALILKVLVPILQHLCWIFRNTPTFSLSDGFQRSYGHCFWDPTFFWFTLYVNLCWTLAVQSVQSGAQSRAQSSVRVCACFQYICKLPLRPGLPPPPPPCKPVTQGSTLGCSTHRPAPPRTCGWPRRLSI